MDTKIALLNSDLEEELHMDQSKGFVVPRKEDKVMKWIQIDIANLLKKMLGVIICFYVDDITIFGNNLNLRNKISKTNDGIELS